MLNGHLDTVSLADYDGDPLDPQIRDGRMYGRGTFDMKGGIAAMMVAAARAVAGGPLRGDVVLACVADEEHGSSGTEEVLESFTADAAIVTEPSRLQVTLAHKGFAWFDVEIEGRAAHGSRPELGVDAIAKAGRFLVALEELGQHLAQGPAHPLLGTGTVHASVIHGGEEASTYPAHCRITLERRTVPGENADSVERELTALLDHLTATVSDFRYRLIRGLHREPFEADPRRPSSAPSPATPSRLSATRPWCAPNPSGPTAPSWTARASPVSSSAWTAKAPTRPPSTSTSPRWTASPASSRPPSPSSVPEPSAGPTPGSGTERQIPVSGAELQLRFVQHVCFHCGNSHRPSASPFMWLWCGTLRNPDALADGGIAVQLQELSEPDAFIELTRIL
ncbi:hypothetical protein GCM10010121_052570 [Streptomyces brasiliensis]|uniref:Succinyl-diaminopimelate desuccinylase n=1 Tax=Streptomyces brasiliensis TaxID=1954 RepID=A0A917KZ64_9ACTN|nr:hypothetical protein GCM10010121_052570 [Streptomyces brasiliensis]